MSLMECVCLLQVFATYPNEDYDRRNEDVDPMAASAEYELEKRVERLDLFPAELEKGREHYKVDLYPMLLCTGFEDVFQALIQPARGTRRVVCMKLGSKTNTRNLTSMETEFKMIMVM